MANKKKFSYIQKNFILFLKKYEPFLEKNLHHVDKLVDINIPFPSYYRMLHNIFKDMNYRVGADNALAKAIKIKPNKNDIYNQAMYFKSRGLWWQAANALSKCIEINADEDIDTYREYAYMLETMNRIDESVKAWKKVELLGTLNSYQYYRYGFVLERIGKIYHANNKYKQAIALDKTNNSKVLGVGIFHEKRNLWIHASKAYKITSSEAPVNAYIFYKLGHALERCYRWKEAEQEYLQAITIDPSKHNWWYRLGFVRERQKNYESASQSYKAAIENSKNVSPYWYYRLGYVLNKQEHFEESCNVFLTDTNSSLNSNNETKESLTLRSIDFLKKCIDKEENFDSSLYFSLGRALFSQGKFKEASNTFIEQRIIQKAYGVSLDKYHKDVSFSEIVNYTEYYERYPLDNKTILYESYHGKSISSNPYAIFLALYSNNIFKDYKHIWVINDKDRIPLQLKNKQNIIFIRKDCDLYMRYLAKAKFLINDSTFPSYFIRKSGQKYLNTWHGTPIKMMGKDIKNEFQAHKNVARNFLQSTHYISPNEFTTKTLLESHDIDETYKGVVAETGYPRQDLMLNTTPQEINDLHKFLGTSADKKTILYAPTWRGVFSESDFDYKKLEESLKTITKLGNINILFRGHYSIEKQFNSNDSGITVVSSEIDTNRLLSIVDILVTDYSSIAFEFMALDRPIIYYAYDKETYENDRGLYFPLETISNNICTNDHELSIALEIELTEDFSISDIQRKAKEKYCPHDDGKASQRVIDLFFHDKQNKINVINNNLKKSILMYGGYFRPNGITTSFLNLTNNIDNNKFTTTITIDPHNIENDDQRLQQFDLLDENINVLSRTRRMLLTPEEKRVIELFNSKRTLYTQEMWDIYTNAFSREYKRLFGEKTFDAVVDFDGYSVFWAAILGRSKNTEQKSSIFQHNNMLGEWKLKYPSLENLFNIYKYYDQIISVSENTMKLNMENLTNKFQIESEKFTFCDNVQNPERIIEKAKLPLEVDKDNTIFKSTIVFINIARLSPEKDQEKLIRAFKRVVLKHKNARLISLGCGPLEHHLHQVISQLRLSKNVFLLGQRFNPYSYLDKAKCFILSSNHEGQPMTLFEALILQKPIIATDIPGNRSVLENRPGALVENSEEGLYEGMLNFIKSSTVEKNNFNHTEYNQNALEMFYSKVVEM